MIIDHRTYTLKPGTLPLYVKAYVDEGHAIQIKHLGKPLGWYTSTDIGALNQIVHLWQYDDLIDRERRRAAMMADPAWLAYIAIVMPYIDVQENKILRTATGVQMK
jgi:hypothetical protein